MFYIFSSSTSAQYTRCCLLTKRDLIEAYATEAVIYDHTRAIFERGRFAARERLLYSQYLRKKGNLLVVACGTGRHFNHICNELSVDVVGIDVCVEMLKIARTKERRVSLMRGDAENLPFQDNVFDAVVCSRAFYLFEDKFAFLISARRVLKTRGHVLVSTFSKGTFITRLCLKLKLLEQDPTEYPYDSKDLCSMLNKVSFKVVHTRAIALITDIPIMAYLPKFMLDFVGSVEDVLTDGRWVMAIGKKM